jgi:hypothetical protein
VAALYFGAELGAQLARGGAKDWANTAVGGAAAGGYLGSLLPGPSRARGAALGAAAGSALGAVSGWAQQRIDGWRPEGPRPQGPGQASWAWPGSSSSGSGSGSGGSVSSGSGSGSGGESSR